MFEIAKRIAVEQEKNGNHFCIAHSSLSIASFRGVWRGIWKRKCFFVQFQLIFFAEIICNTIDSHNFADNFQRIILLLYDWFSTVNIQKTILFLGFYWNFIWGKKKNCLSRIGAFRFHLFVGLIHLQNNKVAALQAGSIAPTCWELFSAYANFNSSYGDFCPLTWNCCFNKRSAK